MESTDFGWALARLREGKHVCRSGWNGKNMWIFFCDVNGTWVDRDGNIYDRQPYLYMKTANNTVVPWVASQSDLLAYDWEVASA